MTVAKINGTSANGMVVLSGNNPVNGEQVVGGFYPVRGSEENRISFFSSINGTAISIHLRLDFETVEILRNQLDVWVVKHWPQE